MLIDSHEVNYASGSGLIKFPDDGIVIVPEHLHDQGLEILDMVPISPEGKEAAAKVKNNIPVMGFHQSKAPGSGRVVVYGDSNCVDSAHLSDNCFWMMDAILEYTGLGNMPTVFSELGIEASSHPYLKNNIPNPQRMEGNRLHRFSKVLETNIGNEHISTKVLPKCRVLANSKPQPLNRTAPTNLYKAQKLMSMGNSIELDAAELLIPVKSLDASDEREVSDWLGSNIGPDDSSSESDFSTNLSIAWLFTCLCVVFYVAYKFCRKRRRFFLRIRMKNSLKGAPSVSQRKPGSTPESPKSVAVDKGNANLNPRAKIPPEQQKKNTIV